MTFQRQNQKIIKYNLTPYDLFGSDFTLDEIKQIFINIGSGYIDHMYNEFQKQNNITASEEQKEYTFNIAYKHFREKGQPIHYISIRAFDIDDAIEKMQEQRIRYTSIVGWNCPELE